MNFRGARTQRLLLQEEEDSVQQLEILGQVIQLGQGGLVSRSGVCTQ